MILEADNIELNFQDKKILSGVYIKAETGKITGLIGRNGSGKTCLLRIIFGDLRSKYKNIRINSIHQHRSLYKTDIIAYLPQHQLLPKNIKLTKALNLFDVEWKNFTNEFNNFDIYENWKTNELSSGELRIIETYLILNSGKSIILLDEPFSFIAPLYINKFKHLIQKKKETSIIIITDHFYTEILDISDTVYFIKNGCSKLIKSKEDLQREGYINNV